MRDAELTRQKILTISADEIHQHGFKSTSLSAILNRCEISKGALYHHFANKNELGYAVFEEIYTPMFLANWQPALALNDPIEGLCSMFDNMCCSMSQEDLTSGCPLNNLCQEMASLDEGFRTRVAMMYEQLGQLIVIALTRVKNQLRDDVQPEQVACFIVACVQGSASLAKGSRCKVVLTSTLAELNNYLRSLKK